MNPSRLRLLFLADAVFEDLPGGSRVVARELARGLAARGHQVTFLVARQTPNTPDDIGADGVRIVRYAGAGQGRAFVRAGRSACQRLWAEQPFDIVHTHFAYAALGPLQAVPKGVPHVRTFHGPWHTEGWLEDCAKIAAARHDPWPRRARLVLRSRVARILRRRVEAINLTRSLAVTVLSDQFRREVLSFGYPAGRIYQIAGGADLSRFFPTDDKAEARRRLGLPSDRRILFSVRRLAPRMGLDHLIEAMAVVARAHPDILLLIGGKGPERERLEAMIADRGLQQNARLVGFIPDADLAAYYQSADLFVLPTVALEGFGLVTAEALACGVPVLGTPVGATPELLSGLDSRLIAPGVGPDALASGICGFLEGDWANSLTPERLHRYVAERFTWERHVQETEALYQALVS